METRETKAQRVERLKRSVNPWERLAEIRRFAGDQVSWISWSVEDLGTRMNILCLPRALAAHAMLRRRGIASRLCLGAAREGGALAAHAWVEIGEDKIVGGADAEGFTRLAEFGGAC